MQDEEVQSITAEAVIELLPTRYELHRLREWLDQKASRRRHYRWRPPQTLKPQRHLVRSPAPTDPSSAMISVLMTLSEGLCLPQADGNEGQLTPLDGRQIDALLDGTHPRQWLKPVRLVCSQAFASRALEGKHVRDNSRRLSLAVHLSQMRGSAGVSGSQHQPGPADLPSARSVRRRLPTLDKPVHSGFALWLAVIRGDAIALKDLRCRFADFREAKDQIGVAIGHSLHKKQFAHRGQEPWNKNRKAHARTTCIVLRTWLEHAVAHKALWPRPPAEILGELDKARAELPKDGPCDAFVFLRWYKTSWGTPLVADEQIRVELRHVVHCRREKARRRRGLAAYRDDKGLPLSRTDLRKKLDTPRRLDSHDWQVKGW